MQCSFRPSRIRVFQAVTHLSSRWRTTAQCRNSSSISSKLVFDSPRNRRWMPHEVEALIRMKRDNIPSVKIATELKRTVQSIESRFHGEGKVKGTTPGRKWTPCEVDTLFELNQRGISVEDIARELNRSHQAVKHRLRQPQSLPNPKPWTKESFDELMNLDQQGMATDAIAAQLRRSVKSIEWRLRRPCYKTYPKPKPWSQREMDTFVARRAQRVPLADIAVELDRSLGSVESRNHGIIKGQTLLADRQAGVPFSREEDEKLMSLRASGERWCSISLKMPGRSSTVLRNRHCTLERKNATERTMDYAIVTWTKEEDTLLQDLSAQGLSLKQIGRELNKDFRVVWWRNRKINPNYQRKRKLRSWTSEEDETMLTMRKEEISWKTIAIKLGPHRTVEATKSRYQLWKKRNASSLTDKKIVGSPTRPTLSAPPAGLASIDSKRGYATKGTAYTSRVSRSWTQEELDTLQRMLKEGRSHADIALELKRTTSSVSSRVSRLSSGKTTASLRFSREDDEKLVQLHDSGMSWRAITPEFPGRAEDVLRSRYNTVKQGRSSGTYTRRLWSEEDINRLWRLKREGHTIEQMGIIMDRSYNSIRDKLSATNPAWVPRAAKWTDDEIALLIRMRADSVPYVQIAPVLGRTCVAARLKFRHLKLSSEQKTEPSPKKS